MKARSLRSRCQKSNATSDGSREGSVSSIFLLASGSSLVCGSIISGSHGILPIHVCVQTSSLDKDTSHIGLEACLLQHDLTLINYMGNNFISKLGPILRVKTSTHGFLRTVNP